MKNNVMVSVICNTYNHEDYIRDALESFVMQKTTFAYEILVHDDASTDRTAEIVREYEMKYPNLVKPIYQTENQYSKGVSVSAINCARAKGKYFAICEGDDYWIEPYKLQKQFDAMEKHTEVDMCVHAAYWVNAESKKNIGEAAPAKEKTVLSVEQVILGGGGYVVTSSLFFRKGLLDIKYRFRDVLNIDYSLQILGALRGGMLYLPDYMSAYRLSTKNSWTLAIQKDKAKCVNWRTKNGEMLKTLDEETHHRYSDAINCQLHRNEWALLELLHNYKEMLSPKYKDMRAARAKYSHLYTVKLWLHAYFPAIYRIIGVFRHGR